MKDTIWCVFSIENNYDQPNDNLVAWWPEKPSREDFVKGFRDKVWHGGSYYNNIAESAAQSMWDNPAVDFRVNNTDYRFEQIKSGFGSITCP